MIYDQKKTLAASSPFNNMHAIARALPRWASDWGTRPQGPLATLSLDAFVSSLIRFIVFRKKYNDHSLLGLPMVSLVISQLIHAVSTNPSNSCGCCTNPVRIASRVRILPVTGLKRLHDLGRRSESVASVQLTTVVLTRRSATLRDQLNRLGSSASFSDGGVLRINLRFGASVPEVMLDRFWNRCCCVIERLSLSLVYALSWDSLKGFLSAHAIRLYGNGLDMQRKLVLVRVLVQVQLQARDWVLSAAREVC